MHLSCITNCTSLYVHVYSVIDFEDNNLSDNFYLLFSKHRQIHNKHIFNEDSQRTVLHLLYYMSMFNQSSCSN